LTFFDPADYLDNHHLVIIQNSPALSARRS
jgi:hypothetical protein